MPLPELRSPLARAVVPVLAGAAVLAVLGLLTWLVAVFIADDTDRSEAILVDELQLGSAKARAQDVAEDGPILLAGVRESQVGRPIVVDHTGGDPTAEWRVYFANLNGDPSCEVNVDRETGELEDCNGEAVDAADLEPASGVRPVVTDRTTLSINLDAP